MTKFGLHFECDNDAFNENIADETARILRKLADRVQSEYSGRMPDDYPVHDINGNRVGMARFYIGRREA